MGQGISIAQYFSIKMSNEVVKVVQISFLRESSLYMRVYRESYTKKHKNRYFYYFHQTTMKKEYKQNESRKPTTSHVRNPYRQSDK